MAWGRRAAILKRAARPAAAKLYLNRALSTERQQASFNGWSGYGSQGDVVRVMGAGARGYILKAGPPEELFRAVRAAAGGGMALAPEVAGHLAGPLADPGAALTERRIQVVRLPARAHSNRSIAASLCLTEATIKTHLVRIYRKLVTENRASRVSEAVRRGLLELGDPVGMAQTVSGRPPTRTRYRTGRRPRSPAAGRVLRSSSACRSSARCARWSGPHNGR